MTPLPARRAKPEAVLAIRCAIYTRVSTDERLGQEFNSLHNQREAAEHYVAAQQHAGWELLPEAYEDPGYSGGNIERPALRRLLTDVEAGRVQRVVVYKIDRLSRSLADFVQVAQFLEKHDASIVSVTQQFDTSTSMGRLTLNMLLSFAQFEREMIAERTSDKMAASRRKGKWVGGMPVLGYDVAPEGGKLVVNQDESWRVREIFRLYLESGALLPVVEELNRRGWRTKAWTTKDGKVREGVPFSKNRLHRMLTNAHYAGRVSYRGEAYPGEHEAIIDTETFGRVQAMLAANRVNAGALARSRHGALLSGLVRCAACGGPMIHAPTVKKNKAYRYYRCGTGMQKGSGACKGGSVPAPALEAAVVERIKAIGQDPAVVAATFAEAQRQLTERAPALAREVDSLRAELARHHQQVGRVVALVAEGGPVAEAARGQLADLQATVAVQEARLREVEVELAGLESATVNEADLRRALEMFTPVWDVLLLPERSRILHLLIELVEYDGAEGRVALTFRPTGIRALAAEERA